MSNHINPTAICPPDLKIKVFDPPLEDQYQDCDD